MADTPTKETAALAEFVRDNSRPQVINPTIGQGDKAEMATLIAYPNNVRIEDAKQYFDKYLPAPRRIAGTSKHSTIESFVAHVNRFKDEASAIFANANAKDPKVLSIYNYNNSQDKPRFGDFRAELTLELSDEWTTWTEGAGEPMTQAQFAEFIESNVADIQTAPDLKDESNATLREASLTLGYAFGGQSDMMTLSKGIAINESAKAKTQVNLQTGERTIFFESEQTGVDGQKLAIPGLFLIAIPVFKDAHIYRLPVRLRYRMAGGAVVWFFDIYRDDKAFKFAYDEAVALIGEKTGIAPYIGEPETK